MTIQFGECYARGEILFFLLKLERNLDERKMLQWERYPFSHDRNIREYFILFCNKLIHIQLKQFRDF